MQQVQCPGCGAQVPFRSAASVLAVCPYCRKLLLKEAAAVRDIGTIAAPFEDYSPLRLGVTGRVRDTGFTLIGRIQLRYDAGYWNEWRALTDDGGEAWLSDASGQYTFTRLRDANQALPAFESLRAGAVLTFAGNAYTASDVRGARCVAGEGELAFRVGEGYELRAADFRWASRFLTLDYSDGDAPKLYLGESVTLDAMRCQALRSPDEIKAAAGRYRGATVSLDCPNCGGPIEYRAGLATQVVCTRCGSHVDCAGDKAEVLARHEALEKVVTTLSVGDEGKLGGRPWSVIGLARHREVDDDEPSDWVEYLLFNPAQGLTWLVETDEGWMRVDVLDTWPETKGDDRRYGGTVYRKLYAYTGEVTFAAGNFNWRVQVGDRVSIIDYARDDDRLTEEATPEEITWSLGKPIATAEVLKSFGKQASAPIAPGDAPERGPHASSAVAAAGASSALRLRWPMLLAWALLVIFNFNLTFIEEDGISALIVALAAYLVYLPLQIAKKFAPGTGA